ncbi:hypothetical protein D3C76_1767040 [compost metagenome]
MPRHIMPTNSSTVTTDSGGSDETEAIMRATPAYNASSMRTPPTLSASQPPTGRKKLPAITHKVVKSAARTALSPYSVLKKIVK